MPSFFPEGDAPLATDPSNKSLQKINSLLQAIETNTAGASGGGLTDAQLRATPVPVDIGGSGSITITSGTVTVSNEVEVTNDDGSPIPISGSVEVSNFPATQPVSGPLTDTQLRATAVPVSGTFWQATQPVSIASAISQKVQGWDIPIHDYRALGYTSGNLTSVTYKTGGASGTTVATLTLGYDGSGNLISLTKT